MKGNTAVGTKVIILGVFALFTTCAAIRNNEHQLSVFQHPLRMPESLPFSIRLKQPSKTGKPMKPIGTPNPDVREVKRFGPGGLEVDLKAFERTQVSATSTSTMVSYKVYVLQGLNIRHYRVKFNMAALIEEDVFSFAVLRRTVRCIRKRYLFRCFYLSLKRQERCTDRIVMSCMPSGFIRFKDASPSTRGRNRSSPKPSPSPTPRVLTTDPLDLSPEPTPYV